MRSSQTSGFCAILDSCEMAQESDISFFPLFSFCLGWVILVILCFHRTTATSLKHKMKTEKDGLIVQSVCAWIISDDCDGIPPFGSLQEVRKQYGSVEMCHRSHSYSWVIFFPIRDVSLFQSNSKKSLAASYISFCLFVISWNLKTLIQSSSVTANFYVKRLLSLC